MQRIRFYLYYSVSVFFFASLKTRLLLQTDWGMDHIVMWIDFPSLYEENQRLLTALLSQLGSNAFGDQLPHKMLFPVVVTSFK